MTAGSAAAAARRVPRAPRLPMLRVTARLHGGALAVTLTLICCAGAILVAASARLHAVAASQPAADWRQMAPEYFSPRGADLVLRVLWILAGVFLGVPLAGRDVATGTAAFAWTQGTSRPRWLLGKLLPVAGLLAAAALGFGLIFGRFYGVYTPAIGRWSAFGLFAPALIGWTLAGLTLAMLAGVALRRSGPALGAAILGYWALDSLISRYLRPRYLPPVSGPAPHPAARVTALVLSRRGSGAWSYQPGSRFWTFQLVELGILLIVALLCTGVTYWLISGRGLPFASRRPVRGRRASWNLDADPSRRARLAMLRVTWRLNWRGLTAAFALLGGTLVLVITRLHAERAGHRPVGDALDLAVLLPVLIGAFLGGSLVAGEIQHETARFAWTQGVRRGRWAAGRLVRSGLLLAAGAVAFGLVFQWWAAPLAADRLSGPLFDLYAPVFAGWTLASCMLGALLGAALADVTSAVILTLIGSLAALAGNAVLRPDYLPLISGPSLPRGAIEAGWSLAGPDGRPLSEALRHSYVTSGSAQAAARWAADHHAVALYTYQPLARFWPLQFVEAGGLLVICVLLGAATVWLVGRREA